MRRDLYEPDHEAFREAARSRRYVTSILSRRARLPGQTWDLDNTSTAATLRRSRAVAGAARRGHVTAMVGNVCSGRGSGRDGGYMSVGTAAHRCAVLQQEERHVI